MRRVHWLPALAAVTLLAGLLLPMALVWAMVTRPWPRTDGSVQVSGLDGEVRVYRDRWGVPQVYAATRHDLFFAQGYVHSQDRFTQMEFWRRLGSGRLSELYGERTLDQDRLVRMLGWRRTAEEEYRRFDADTRAALDAYAEGVNTYVASHAGRLGLEFTLLWFSGVRFSPEPWVPADSLTWGKVMAWELGGGVRADLLRAALVDRVGIPRTLELLPPYPDDRPLIVPGESAPGSAGYIDGGETVPRATLVAVPWEALDGLGQALGAGPGLGSNNWVLSGDRTVTGRPIVANDPHLRAQMPSVWYEIGLHCDPVGPACSYQVVGASFPGLPGVLIGHNDRIAWGLTNTNPDVNDLYVERVNPMNPDEYRVGEEWAPMDVRIEVVNVHGRDEPVHLRVRGTRHGPIINDVAATDDPWAFGWQPLAMCWTGSEPGMMVRAILELDRAGNWDEFRAALQGFDAPSQNFVYADVDGNVGYQMTGRIPIRRDGLGAMPAQGWTDGYEWVATIDYGSLPSVLNPADGSVVTANNMVVGSDYPYYLGHDWSRGLRAARIEQMLAARDAVGVADCCAVQADALVPYAEGVLRHLASVTPTDRRTSEAVEQLRRWDRRADADAVAPAIFASWHLNLAREVFGDELGDDVLDRYLFSSSSSVLDALDDALNGDGGAWCDDVRTPATENCAQIAARAFDRALDDLTERLGPNLRTWRWGRLHQVTFTHPTIGRSGVGLLEALVNRGPVATDGTCDTVMNVCFDPREPYAGELLPSYRQIVDVGAWERSVAINSTGQSGHPFHRHYADMIAPWQEGEYHPMLWYREHVEREAVGVLVLGP